MNHGGQWPTGPAGPWIPPPGARFSSVSCSSLRPSRRGHTSDGLGLDALIDLSFPVRVDPLAPPQNSISAINLIEFSNKLSNVRAKHQARTRPVPARRLLASTARGLRWARLGNGRLLQGNGGRCEKVGRDATRIWRCWKVEKGKGAAGLCSFGGCDQPSERMPFPWGGREGVGGAGVRVADQGAVEERAQEQTRHIGGVGESDRVVPDGCPGFEPAPADSEPELVPLDRRCRRRPRTSFFASPSCRNA